MVLAAFKFPPFTTIFLGALAGGLLAVFMAPARVIAFADPDGGLPAALALFKGVWLALASGYKSSTGIASIDLLASRGGMDSMLNTIWLIITALAFGGVVEKAGVLDRLITPIIEKAKSNGALVASLVSSIIATNVITADQYIAIVLPGRMFKGAFQKRGLAPVVALAHGRGFGHAHVVADPVEQLRRLHGRDAGRRDLALCPLRHLLHREPAADDRRLRMRAFACCASRRHRPTPPNAARADDPVAPAAPATTKMRQTSQGSCLVSPNPAARPTRHPQRATALLALATLALLSACNRAAEAPQPEVRPVRAITIEKRNGGRFDRAHRLRAGADRDQPRVPDRRPDARARP